MHQKLLKHVGCWLLPVSCRFAVAGWTVDNLKLIDCVLCHVECQTSIFRCWLFVAGSGVRSCARESGDETRHAYWIVDTGRGLAILWR